MDEREEELISIIERAYIHSLIAISIGVNVDREHHPVIQNQSIDRNYYATRVYVSSKENN